MMRRDYASAPARGFPWNDAGGLEWSTCSEKGPQSQEGEGLRAVLRSELEAKVQIVLSTVVVERGGSRCALVVSQRRRVEVQRIEADTDPVRGLVVERQRHGSEIVLVIRVGTRQADQERVTIAVVHPRREHLILEIGAQ